jgi:hypothetical protein
MDSRRHIRAKLRALVSLRGTDRRGMPFEIQGRTVDFSRRGVGLVIDADVIAPGAFVFVDVPKRFNCRAVVQWTRLEPGGQVRIGLRLLHYQAGIGLRVAASALLCVALAGQIGMGRSRAANRGRQAGSSSCTVSLERMKGMVGSALIGVAYVSDSDKAFLHIQHERLGCEEYTRIFEKSDFFDPKIRAALAQWHWSVYHGKDGKARAAEMQRIDAILSAVH